MSKTLSLNDEIRSKPKIKTRTKDIELDESVTFNDLNLSKEILSGLQAAGFEKPSPIQLKAIPLGKLGLDLIVQAKSGTGKTCVFSVITLENIILESKALQALILAPTREIAIQICDFIRKISKTMKKLKCHAFIGGQSLNEDKQKLSLCHIAVGTPGRIYHLISEKQMKPDNIRLFIIDEADKLLAPEFQKDVNLIYSNLPENKQMIALSATYPTYMATYVTRYMRSATFVRLNIIDPSLRGIKQFYKIIPYSKLSNLIFEQKIEELVKLLSSINFSQAIIFTNYQMKAEHVCQSLIERNWPAVFISGNIDQSKRNAAMSQLKQFKCRILVSTDLTARGIDAENVDLVVNMDIPLDAETYLHRIGRAGRYGCEGYGISFVAEKDETELFNEIISKYNLRISQFSDNLDNIISININPQEKIDDVTIEKVKITEKQLDESLKEYKLAKKNFEEITKKKFKKLQDLSESSEESSLEEIEFTANIFYSVEEIEKNIEKFKLTNKFEAENLDKKKESYLKFKEIKDNKKLSLEDLRLKRLKFNLHTLNKTENFKVSEKIESEIEESIDTRENIEEEYYGSSSSSGTEINSENETEYDVHVNQSLHYGHYYSQYYFKYFKHFCKKI